MPTPSPATVAGARGAPQPGSVLGRRALNRALLARQGLLPRWRLPAGEAIERLVGLQAQAPDPPYVGLWTRLDGFHPADLADLLNGRRTVRIALMRSTIHLVTARDCLLLPLIQPAIDRGLQAAYGRLLTGIEPASLAAAGRDLVARHVTNNLTKLNVGSRVAATAFAIRHDLAGPGLCLFSAFPPTLLICAEYVADGPRTAPPKPYTHGCAIGRGGAGWGRGRRRSATRPGSGRR